MADKTFKGKRFVAVVDLGGIGISAGDEFEVDDCNCHLDFGTLLATGAIEPARVVKLPAEKGENKPDAGKPPAAGGEGGR